MVRTQLISQNTIKLITPNIQRFVSHHDFRWTLKRVQIEKDTGKLLTCTEGGKFYLDKRTKALEPSCSITNFPFAGLVLPHVAKVGEKNEAVSLKT